MRFFLRDGACIHNHLPLSHSSLVCCCLTVFLVSLVFLLIHSFSFVLTKVAFSVFYYYYFVCFCISFSLSLFSLLLYRFFALLHGQPAPVSCLRVPLFTAVPYDDTHFFTYIQTISQTITLASSTFQLHLNFYEKKLHSKYTLTTQRTEMRFQTALSALWVVALVEPATAGPLGRFNKWYVL